MTTRIPVGISACLTGQSVRHDGGHRHSRYCTDVLADCFDLQPLCPEAGAGLGVPRPAMQLVANQGALMLRENRDTREHTAALSGWIEATLPRLAGLRGFILMQKSPSCGMARIPVYDGAGQVIHRRGTGLFAAALMERYPLMPVEEAGRLNDAGLLENFVERVFAYDDWLSMEEAGLTRQGLIDFHTRHKFQLLAHCQRTYRALGPLLADFSAAPLETIAQRYIQAFMPALTGPVSPGAHANAMLHLLGYFRDRLDAAERGALVEQVEAYMRGEVPLVVPMTLLRLAQRRFPSDYVAAQHYLRPYPDHLGLRNRL